MCTVSYLPLPSAGYILTSNRDETPDRPTALPINHYRIGDRTVYFPKDPQGGGTWIATTGDESTVCLLNGGFIPHITTPEHRYRKSRGMVVLDYFLYADCDAYAASCDFSNIEPFTLIVLEKKFGRELCLTELRWDGQELFITPMDTAGAYIWSSVTLYSPEVRALRRDWFERWLSGHPTYTQEEILDFHTFAGDGNRASGLVMEDKGRQTVSICSIRRAEGLTTAIYADLRQQQTSNYLLYH